MTSHLKSLTLICFIYTVLNLLGFNSLFSQSVRQHVINYTPKEYGDSCNAQNWSVVQDRRGITYFGNASKILEFDGVKWRTVRTPIGGSFVTSLANNENGNIYVGAFGEFGYLKPNDVGKLEYMSLSVGLSDNDAFFSNIWRIFTVEDIVIFFSQEKLFILQNDKIKVIDPQTSFHLAFVVNNTLYVRQRDIGLMKYLDGNLQLVPNGEIFKDYGVFGIFPTKDKSKYLIVTQEIGLFEYFPVKTDSAIIPLISSDTEKLNNSVILGGILLNDNKIALNTSQKGVIIINSKGEIVQIIDINTGIKDNDVKQVYQDSNNNLWFAMNTGVCQVNYSSPISIYNSNTGLTGNIKTIMRFDSLLYVGTSDGLYVQNTLTENKQYKHFIQYGNFNKAVLKLLVVKNMLLIATNDGLYYLNKNSKIINISNLDASAMYWSDISDLLFVAGQKGFAIYNFKNVLKQEKIDRNIIIHNALNICEKIDDNKEVTDLWIGTLNEGIWNLTIDKNFSIIPENYFGEMDGLSQGWTRVYEFDDNVVFGDISGLLKFAAIEEELSDTAKDNEFDYRGYFEPANVLGLTTETVTNFEETKNKIWLCLNGKVAFFDENKITEIPFLSIDEGTINVLFPDNNRTWIGGNEGLILFDNLFDKEYNKPPVINIRNVTCTGDSVLFYGVYLSENDMQNSTVIQPDNFKPVLKYKFNTISFEFASIYNENGSDPEYSYMVEGFDDNWSDWAPETNVKYKKIPAGKYTFLVKAKDVYNNESKTVKYEFEILPPWHQTVLAYIVYVIIFILALWIFIKLYTRKLKKDKERLEKIVIERTAEIRKQKDEIEEQKNLVTEQRDHITEINQEITDSILYAKRIQKAILPHEEYANDLLSDYFIFFRPKDIVSGDFYWLTQTEKHIIITAADCTGHGVPGAFMSMLGVASLNEIVSKQNIRTTGQVLDSLREYIIRSLQQTGKEGEQKDGMDIAICAIDTESNNLQFSGANNPLYLIRHISNGDKLSINSNGESKDIEPSITESDYNLFQIKGDSMPVSIHVIMNPFTNYEINTIKDDRLYMFSDGFPDQFGGEKGKKFMYKPFKRLLLQNVDKPMKEQKDILSKAFDNWKATTDKHGETYEQIDDVVVLGIKL